MAAKPYGALAALAEATLAAAKGDVAQGEAAVPARGRRISTSSQIPTLECGDSTRNCSLWCPLGTLLLCSDPPFMNLFKMHALSRALRHSALDHYG